MATAIRVEANLGFLLVMSVEKGEGLHEADFAEVIAVSAEREPNGGGMGSFSRWLQEGAY